MSYLCIYDGISFSYHPNSDFKDGQKYTVGRWSPEYQPDICLGPEFQDISTRQGKITSRYNNLYYTESLNKMPVRFELASGESKMDCVLFSVDEKNGKTFHVERIQIQSY